MPPSRFDALATSWDDNPVRVALARDVVAAILRQLPITTAMTAMDFGCGTGLVTLGMAEHVHTIMGIDNSAGMLEVLAQKAQAAGLMNVTTRLLDLEEQPVPDDLHVDLIVSAMALHHIADVPRVLADFRTLLAPGGYVALADLVTEDGSFHSADMPIHHRGFSPDWLMEQLRALGFTELEAVIATTITRAQGEYPVFLVRGRNSA